MAKREQALTPPPLPQKRRRSVSWRVWGLIAVGLVPGLSFGALLVLRLLGLLYPFYIPVGSMAPALCKGDQVLTEGVTFLVRSPRRGEIVVFKADQIEGLRSGTFYVKRVAGLPGDHLSIADGKLFIDDKLVILSNNEGQIVYDAPPNLPPNLTLLQTNVVVPAACYFLLGDNSTNSFDSRFFGSVPGKEIVGRILLRYRPPSRRGTVK